MHDDHVFWKSVHLSEEPSVLCAWPGLEGTWHCLLVPKQQVQLVVCCCCLGELSGSMKRLSRSAGCSTFHSLREQSGGVCCVYFLTQRLQEGQVPRGSHSARADIPPAHSAQRGHGTFEHTLGEAALHEALCCTRVQHNLVFLGSPPLFQ